MNFAAFIAAHHIQENKMDRAPDKADKQNELLRIDEVARLLKVSESSIRSYRKTGRIPEPIYLSQLHVRWRRNELEQWMAAGCPKQYDVLSTERESNE